MAKLKFQTLKLKPDKQDLEKIVQQTVAIIQKNDADLTEEEIDFERTAEKLPITQFPRIHPRKATIGFLLRNMNGRNFQAIEFLRMTLPANIVGQNLSNIGRLILTFDNLDVASQNRVDCLDWLARKHNVNIMRFIQFLQEGIIAHYNFMTATVIAESKPELAQRIINFSKDKKQNADRRLAAEMSGLVSDKPSVIVDQSTKIDKSDHRTQVLSFTDFQKQNDKVGRKALKAAEEDYVEGQVVNE